MEIRQPIEVSTLAEGALSDICTQFNPRKLTKDDFAHLIEASLE